MGYFIKVIDTRRPKKGINTSGNGEHGTFKTHPILRLAWKPSYFTGSVFTQQNELLKGGSMPAEKQKPGLDEKLQVILLGYDGGAYKRYCKKTKEIQLVKHGRPRLRYAPT